MLGGFSPEALEIFQLAASEQAYNFSEEDTYDFTRCVRPDGSAYGTGGRCVKGSQAEKSPTEGRAVDAAKKPKATSSELRDQQRALFGVAKEKRTAAKEAEKAFKAVEKETKGDMSKEAKKRRLEAGRAWDKASTAADRAQTAWMKAHEKWSRATERDNLAKMSPAQRAETKRINKIIKEQG
jgi:hypothetical protein